MQSGKAQTREWQLDYEPEQPQAIEPLMGWTSSGDMKQQLTLRFDTKGRRRGLLRAQGHSLPGDRAQGARPPTGRLCRQFCVPARRALDPLESQRLRLLGEERASLPEMSGPKTFQKSGLR